MFFTNVKFIVIVVFVGVVVFAGFKIYGARDAALIRTDMSVYTKLNEALTYYVSSAQQLPGGLTQSKDFRKSGDAIFDLTSRGLLLYTDLYSQSLKRSIIFRDCGDTVNFNLYNICVGFSQTEERVSPVNVSVWPPSAESGISAVPVKFACYAEQILDDKNYNSGNGFSAAGNRTFEYKADCSHESMKPDTTGEFDYIYSVGKI